MKTFIPSLSACFGLALCANAGAVELSFSGFFDGDVAGYHNADTTSDNGVDYQANHEMDLTATAKLNDRVSVDLYATTYTVGSTGGTVPAQGSPAENRWTGFVYDGVVATMQATPDLKLRFGDLVYTSGQFNYYGYKRTNIYAVGLKETGFRGLEADYKGVSVSAGTDGSSVYGAYGAYDLALGKVSAKPFGFYSADESNESYKVRAGVDGSASIGDQTVKFAYGFYKDKGDEVSNAIAIEPILSFGSVSLSATAFFALLDKDDPSVISVPEWMFFYAEPGYAFNSTFSVGLPLEYHTMTTDRDADLSELWAVPTAYFAFADNFTWSVWGQASLRIGSDIENNDPYFGFGSELSFNF